jgi:hypothetical protein
MKMNWGTGIAIVITLFVIAVGTFAWFAGTQKVNLVEKDYYPKELTYGEKMQRIANSEALEENIQITFDPEYIFVRFPTFTHKDKPEGTIQLYRPSDYREDKFFPIQINDSGYQYLPKENLLMGKYTLKIEWEFESIEYYFEQSFLNK